MFSADQQDGESRITSGCTLRMISLRKACSSLAVTALVLSACSDDPTGSPLKAQRLRVVGKSAIVSLANLPSPDPVQVRLELNNYTGLPARLVVFTVTGAAKLSDDSVFTDDNGVASVVVTAAAAGTYTVTASSEGVAPVTVTLTARNPTSNVIAVFSGSGQAGLAGEPLVPFTAIVLKEDGTPVGAGVPVTFSVTGGGGTLSSTSTVTDANGKASTTLTLGVSGPQTVTASSPGVVGTAFTATVADPCSAARQATTPGSFTRTLDTTDCHNAQNRYVEFFNTSVTATPLSFTESSTAFVPSFSIRAVGGTDTIAFRTPGAGDATFKAFLAPGSYWLAPSTSAANATGSYTVTSTTIAGTDVTGCERVYITRGANSGDQTIAATDCQLFYDDGNGAGSQLHYGDRYRIFLKAGDKIVITQEGTADHFIRVTDLATGVVANRDNNIIGVKETMNFTAQSSGQYLIEAATFNNNTGGVPPDVGTYKLTVAAAP